LAYALTGASYAREGRERNTSFLEWTGVASGPIFRSNAANAEHVVTGARTPEELELLFEDAFVVRDRGALAQLFEAGAVLGAAPGEARGGEQIGRLAAAMWEGEYNYLADPQRVVQARDTALVVSRQGINVVRRRSDGNWLYAISLLDVYSTQGEAQ
jgi:hypothetical protein